MAKPTIPKGTRDFSPEQVAKRNFIFGVIRSVFEKYGYQPIETPTMESLSTLTGKYGEEGDQLLFKVLNNGDFLSKADKNELANQNSNKVLSSISKRGLRYDLTVPFARYVVMHQHEISFPFKRYQIQPVWRADRPQKGRYQEFYQCDVDVVGSNSLMYEAELVQIYNEAFEQLGLEVTILVNNRKVLYGIAEAAGIEDKFMDMTIVIDKLDKIGMEKVKEQLSLKDIDDAAIAKIVDMLQVTTLDELDKWFENTTTGKKGIEELRTFHKYLDSGEYKNEIKFDISLARGLSYYTGCIFEVKAKNIQMGSVGGGGRYDDLTSMFGLKDISGVGVSFGAARIFDAMEELQLFPESVTTGLEVLVVAFDESSHTYGFTVLNKLRAAGIIADLYPTPTKIQKQMKYANARKVNYTILIGSEEMNSQILTLKEMESGDQVSLKIEDIIHRIKS